MQPFTQVTGVAVPLNMMNVDTDMIIPKQFLKTIKRTGLSEGLFHELRTNEDGSPKPFVMDEPAYRGAQILIAGENFGCGSSREHAPWALLDAGIRCVIAPSFGDIFYNNCFKNGILPIRLPEERVHALLADAKLGQNARITVDLEGLTITRPNGEVFLFEVTPFRRHCLLNGLDEVALTLEKDAVISDYESRRRASQPWL